MADLYRKRWTLETAFQHLEAYFHSEINTLGYPKAALFGFCLALVAYNLLAVVLAALRGVHGEEIVDEEVSLYYVANEISTTYHGMMIAIPPPEWDVFYSMSPADLAAILLELAQRCVFKRFEKVLDGLRNLALKGKSQPGRGTLQRRNCWWTSSPGINAGASTSASPSPIEGSGDAKEDYWTLGH